VTLKEKILEAAEFVRERINENPEVGLVLGTGLGSLGDSIDNATVLSYSDIPHFPDSTVKFHAGKLVCGRLNGKSIIVMQGRFHYYEGYPMRDITLPIRMMHALGVRTLILSNAAGGIREELVPGTLTLITDHLNLMGTNPLIGEYDEFLGERFPDMSEPYSRELRGLAHQVADELGIELIDNIYAAVSGPSFETPAEIRMLQRLGADSVGMSVVPEALVARQLGIRLLGITAITDQALPEKMAEITHEEVSRVAREITPKFNALIKGITGKL